MQALLLALIAPALAGPDTAMIGFQSAQDQAQVQAAVARLGGRIRYCYPLARLCAADFSAEPPLARLSALPGVRYALRDELMPVTQEASYPDADGTSDCSDLWELDRMEATSAWDLADGSGAEPVAIEDSGFLLTHEELSGTSAYTWDYGDSDSGVEVVYGVTVPGHGTFIAGMISANGSNSAGRAGLAPGGSIAYQKIADRSSALYYSYAINAMSDVAGGDAGGARILSYSLASNSSYTPFEDAVEGLGDAGVLLVAAAANCTSAHCSDADNDRYPEYPASYDGDFIISVAGTLEDDTLNPYSHYGATSVDLAAPGADLCSLGIDSNSDYETESGTSYATPLVAAAASLVWELHPDLGPEDVAWLLENTVEPSSDLVGKVASGGRLDVLDALQAPLPELEDPEGSVTLDPTGSLALNLEDRASAATATLLLMHDPSVRVSDAGVWTVTRYEAGESFTFGDETVSAGSDVATVLQASLAAHTSTTLTITLEASAVGTSSASVRLWEEGASGVGFGAPDEGYVDGTGAYAYAFSVLATSSTGGGDTGQETGGGDDSAQGDDSDPPDETGGQDSQVADDDSGGGGGQESGAPDSAKGAGGCACASPRARPGEALLPGLLALLALRRGRSRRRSN